MPAKGHGSLSLATRRLEVEQARLEALGVPMDVRGALDLGPVPRGQWRLETPRGQPPTCAGLLRAQPAPVRQVLAGVTP